MSNLTGFDPAYCPDGIMPDPEIAPRGIDINDFEKIDTPGENTLCDCCYHPCDSYVAFTNAFDESFDFCLDCIAMLTEVAK